MNSHKKILLVDDADTVLMVERVVLNKGNFILLTAKNGQEAVNMAIKEKPDLILMDVIMPTMNGFEACQILKGREETRLIPIILVTTGGDTPNIEKGYQCGCADYITKPIKGPELLYKINKYLGT